MQPGYLCSRQRNEMPMTGPPFEELKALMHRAYHIGPHEIRKLCNIPARRPHGPPQQQPQQTVASKPAIALAAAVGPAQAISRKDG